VDFQTPLLSHLTMFLLSVSFKEGGKITNATLVKKDALSPSKSLVVVTFASLLILIHLDPFCYIPFPNALFHDNGYIWSFI
jgi:hypothetical protein